MVEHSVARLAGLVVQMVVRLAEWKAGNLVALMDVRLVGGKDSNLVVTKAELKACLLVGWLDF